MPPKPIPEGSILDGLESIVRGGQKIWRSPDGQRLYTWDSLHGEVEIYNKRGQHLGVQDPCTGKLIKDAVKGRRIDV